MNREHMGYMDTLKEGVRVANRNLPVLLTQIVAGVALALLFMLFVFILAVMAVGAIPKLGMESFSPESIPSLIETSFTLIAAGVFLVILFIIVAALVTSYVHAGNMGCIIETARGSLPKFGGATFFSCGRRFMVSMLGLYFIWGLFMIGGLIVFFAAGGVLFEAVLIPLRDAGKGLAAFGLGVPSIIVMTLAALLFLFFLYAGWAFSGIILVGEEKHAFSSLQGSYDFIKRHFWDSLLFALLMFLLVFAGNVLTNAVIGLFNLGLGRAQDTLAAALGVLPLFFLGVFIQMYLGLVARSGFAAFYVDRTRQPAPAIPVAPAAPSVPAETPEPPASDVPETHLPE